MCLPVQFSEMKIDLMSWFLWLIAIFLPFFKDWCYEDPECGKTNEYFLALRYFILLLKELFLWFFLKIFISGPSHWAGTCKSGKSQSPIDLNGTLGSVRGPSQRLRFDSDYFKEHPKFYVTNNGHTGKVTVFLEIPQSVHMFYDAA